jgi:cytochrome c5
VVVHIQDGGISSFTPALSAVRDLPAMEAKPLDIEKEYTASCAMCHDSFLSPGASEWAGYTAKGMDAVYKNGIDGTDTGMPAMGGAALSEKDFKRMVDYLVDGK